MKLFRLNFDNQTLIIIITSIIWAINFRTTYKTTDNHMDSGSYPSLKFDHNIILIKNILSCFFILGFFFESKSSESERKIKELIQIKEGCNTTNSNSELSQDTLLNSVVKLNKLDNIKLNITFWIKIFLIILIIYIIEEIYFIIDNNHFLDRLVCPMRNLGILISITILSPILISNTWVFYRHQLIPIIMILILSLSIIIFNFFFIKRFSKIFGINFWIYLISFLLMGIEMVLTKFLVDKKFISIFIILSIKGIIGSFIFIIINIIYSRKEFFDIFYKFLDFEYEDMFIEFNLFQKSLYIISLLILEYLKILTINKFSENHLLATLMITDLIYFPLFCIERFAIQGFGISTKAAFFANIILATINVFLMLIFNEILECNFWKLNINLKKNINTRQRKDYLLENELNSEDEDYSYNNFY